MIEISDEMGCKRETKNKAKSRKHENSRQNLLNSCIQNETPLTKKGFENSGQERPVMTKGKGAKRSRSEGCYFLKQLRG